MEERERKSGREGGIKEREGERERARARKRKRGGESERVREIERGRESEREIERGRESEREIERGRESERARERKKERKKEKKKERETERERERAHMKRSDKLSHLLGSLEQIYRSSASRRNCLCGETHWQIPGVLSIIVYIGIQNGAEVTTISNNLNTSAENKKKRFILYELRLLFYMPLNNNNNEIEK